MLLSGKSLKHDFIRFVSATMASQVVFSLYSMVDGLMVSIGVNEYAMSAVNLAIPFTNALQSTNLLSLSFGHIFPYNQVNKGGRS